MPPTPTTSSATYASPAESPPWTRANAAAAAAAAAAAELVAAEPLISSGHGHRLAPTPGGRPRSQRSASARASQALTRQAHTPAQATPATRSRRPTTAYPSGAATKPPPPFSLAAATATNASASASASSNRHSSHSSSSGGAAVSASASRSNARRKRPHESAGTLTASLKPPPGKRARHAATSVSHSRPPKSAAGRPKAPPNAKNDADYDDVEANPESKASAAAADDAEPEFNCCICMTEPEHHDLSTIDGCDHRFCFPCIAQWSERENTCPLCKHRFHKICRVHPQKSTGAGRHSRGSTLSSSGRGRYCHNTKTVKNRDQRADFVGAGLEGLLQSMAAASGAGNGGAPFNIMASAQFRSFIMSRIAGGVAATNNGSAAAAAAASANSNAGSSVPSAAALASSRFTFAVNDNYFDDDEDDTDDDEDEEEDFNPFTFFLRSSRFRAAPFATSIPAMAVLPIGGGGPVFSASLSTSPPHPPPPPPPPRSYAINANDRTAGSDPLNPLEIPDSDDDDGDDSSEVQVVEAPVRSGHVSQLRGSASGDGAGGASGSSNRSSRR